VRIGLCGSVGIAASGTVPCTVGSLSIGRPRLRLIPQMDLAVLVRNKLFAAGAAPRRTVLRKSAGFTDDHDRRHP